MLLSGLTIEAYLHYNVSTIFFLVLEEFMRSDTSTERAIRRRLAILVLLHRGPHRYDEIIAALDRDHLFVYDYAEDPAAIAR